MEFRDYYEVLGVDKTADAQTIKRAYRKLAKRYHPDLHPEDRAAQDKFKQVTEAYEVLGDEEKRRKYDAFGASYNFAGGQTFDPSAYGFNFGGAGGDGFTYTYSGTGNPEGFSDFFNMFFGSGGRSGAGRFSSADLSDLFSSGARSARVKAKAPEKRADVVKRITLSPWAAYLGTRRTLKTPQGKLSVRIPPGVRTGQRIRIPGRGRKRLDGTHGDLFLEVAIANPETLTAEQLERYSAWAEADSEG